MIMHRTNLYSLIKMRIPLDDGTYKPIDYLEYEQYSIKFREFLLSTCRQGKMREQLARLSFATRTPYEIYERLVYSPRTDMVQYIPGQDYRAEINYIKRLLLE